MAGYSGTPLVAKLGIRAGCRVRLSHAPDGLGDSLTPFPPDCSWVSGGQSDVHIAFYRSYEALEADLESLAHSIGPNGGLWIAWPKKASRVPTDITEDRLRDLFLPNTDLVDNKVCAIDDVWSGLRFVVRKERR